MSLRARLITSIVIVLLISLCVGAALAGWHAIRSVRAEMQAALNVGAQTLRSGIEARDRPVDLTRLVRAFDGNRHVRAELLSHDGRLQAASTLAASAPGVPAWFVAQLAPSLAPVRFELSDGGAVTVAADPRNEISEVWTQMRDDLVVTGLFCGLSMALVSFVVGRALRPLDRLAVALGSLGGGEYAVRVEQAGPPELAGLARGFNEMVARLAAAHARNQRLNEQLLTLQEEERIELARDLHDEVGAFLFAVALDAAAIEHGAAAGRIADVAERAGAIREAVGHMQRHVRAMLQRLRPANPVEAGLSAALGNLVAFWRARRPAITFALEVAVDDDTLDDPTLAAIYRMVQEGLNNALRHGRPRNVRIVVEAAMAETPGGVLVRVADDGAGLAASDKPGLGITGMRERVEGLGGTLTVGAGEQGRGLTLTALLPVTSAMEVA